MDSIEKISNFFLAIFAAVFLLLYGLLDIEIEDRYFWVKMILFTPFALILFIIDMVIFGIGTVVVGCIELVVIVIGKLKGGDRNDSSTLGVQEEQKLR